MSNQIGTVPKPAAQALSCLPIFGPPPLLKGEDAAAYDDLLIRVSGNLKPSHLGVFTLAPPPRELPRDSYRKSVGTHPEADRAKSARGAERHKFLGQSEGG